MAKEEHCCTKLFVNYVAPPPLISQLLYRKEEDVDAEADEEGAQAVTEKNGGTSGQTRGVDYDQGYRRSVWSV